MADPNLSELVTTTLRDRQGELADNVSKSNALLSVLSRKGNIDLVSGGRTIVRELEYAENSTFMYYSASFPASRKSRARSPFPRDG